jgi:hypothetical protein
MTNPGKCSIKVVKCDLLALLSNSTDRSLDQSIMALNWAAVADELDSEALTTFLEPRRCVRGPSGQNPSM